MSSFAARKEDEAKAAMPSPWLQERGSTGLRHGLQGPQERGQVQDRQVPGGTQGQGHAFECCKAGGGKEGQEGYSQGRTGAETSRAVSGCLEIPQGHRQGKGQGGRQGRRRRPVLVARRNMPTISSRATPNKARSLAWPMSAAL